MELSPILSVEVLRENGYFLYLSGLYCFLILITVEKAKKLNFETRATFDLIFILMCGGFIGARLFHVFYENPHFYLQNPWRIFQFWQGGFVIYGGGIFAVAAAGIYLKWRELSFLAWADFFAPICALGYILGRFSCLIAGCCYGQFTKTLAFNLPWALNHRHPTPVYAMLTETINLLLINFLARRPRPLGHIFYIWLIGHSLGRIIMEVFRADDRGSEIFGLSISTVLSLVFIFIGSSQLISPYFGAASALKERPLPKPPLD